MPGDIYRVLALRLRERRRKAGLTLDALGEQAGITGAFIAHIEAGRKRPTLDTVAKLAEALGTTAAGLLKEDARLDGKRAYAEQFTQCLSGLSDRQRRSLLELARAAAKLARRS